MRILIAAGKSGGHIFPALSLACRLKKRLKDIKIFFIGEKDELTERILSKQQYPFFTIPITRLPFKICLEYIKFSKKLGLAIVPIWSILRRTRPDIVIGFGGAIAGPVLLLSSLSRITTIIHEQNVIPGRTNRILANFVDRIAISFLESERFFNRRKVVLTGNPVRRSVLGQDKIASRKELGLDDDKFTILIIGGSQGSSRLNEIVWRTFSEIDRQGKIDFQLIHITGERDYYNMRQRYQTTTFNSAILPFYDKMGIVYAASNLVLTRAGASTISEITSCGLGSILVPYPYAGSHQLANAQALTERGGAVLIEEREISTGYLRKIFSDLVRNKPRLNKMAKKSKDMGRPHADESLADEVMRLVNK